MADVLVWLREHIHEHSLLYFMAIYIGGGRPVAILTARLAGFNMLLFFPLVVFMDTLQIPCFYFLYDHTFTNGRLQRFTGYLHRRGESAEKQGTFQRLRSLGGLGVLVLTVLPVKGGGMWSGVLLAHLIQLPKRTSLPLLVSGSVAGSLIFVGIGDAILRLWHLVA